MIGKGWLIGGESRHDLSLRIAHSDKIGTIEVVTLSRVE